MNTAFNIHVPISIEKDLNELILNKQIKLNDFKEDYNQISQYENELLQGNKDGIEEILRKLMDYEKTKNKYNTLNKTLTLCDYLNRIYEAKERGVFILKELVR